MNSSSLIDFLVSELHNTRTPSENEFQTQSAIFKDPNIKDQIVHWIDKYKPDKKKSIINSNRQREDGNRLFRANKKQNATEASRCYTNAIFAAPDGSRALALAHANRSASIAELGYYKEAFEDCECAIVNGYPNENLQKIVTRQAFCANKLEDYDKLKACVEKLRGMTLSGQFENQRTAFEGDLTRLSKNDESKTKPVPEDNDIRQNILSHPEKGRYLTSSRDIVKGEIIMSENAFSLVPVEELIICRNCAAQHIIPFPCNICSSVFYCSLKCKKAQEMVHKFECYAYRCGLVSTVGIAHLAMNTLLKGLPSIIQNLKNCKGAKQIWDCIEDISKSGNKGYAEILTLVTNLKFVQLDKEAFRVHCLSASVVAIYLMEFTSFFDLFKGSTCSKFEWGVITSALLLRHITQMIYNGFTSLTVCSLDETYQFQSLSNMWVKCYHLKKGQLHTFSLIRRSYAGIFPHLSFCNHSCEPSFTVKFDGDRLTTYARHEIEQEAEIHNAYMPDFRNYSKIIRKDYLKMTHHFDCTCHYCSDDYDDHAYYQFYRYRCQNSSCGTIFIPRIEKQDWWLEENEFPSFLTCPACKIKLKLDWYSYFVNLTADTTEISKVIKIFELSEKILVGYSELRSHMCETAVKMFFDIWKRGARFSDLEFESIGKTIKYWLDVIEEKNDVRNLKYIAKATFALDLMAHGRYFDFDCKKICISLDMLSTEMRTVFNNYINDYIGERFYANATVGNDIGIPPSKNEFQTQLELFKYPNIKDKIVNWISKYNPDNLNKSIVNSVLERENGNRLFRANKKEKAIDASRCYTNAIILAPDGSRALALAHANRAASLAELGYYKEEYDDCECAINFGYPNENLDKIVTRQSFCANKLEDYDKLKACLEKLSRMTLSGQFENQRTAFEGDLTRLSTNDKSKTEPVQETSDIRHKIINDPEKKRPLTTSRDIAKDEVIFTETAFSLVPVKGRLICRNCAAQNIIPFPCNICSKVVYCSLKCRKAQGKVHKFECYAYRCGLATTNDNAHLAMNTLLKGLPSIIQNLQKCKDARQIWDCIEDISKSGNKGYAEILTMVTNLKFVQLDKEAFRAHCLNASVVAIYLMEFTSFFDLFKGSICSKFEWGVITAALLLKHIIQNRFNNFTVFTVCFLDETYQFQSLSNMWVKCYHLKKGQLHMLSLIRESHGGIFPLLSSCNHSCEPSFTVKFDGDRLTTFAPHELEQGAGIHIACTPDFRKMLKLDRKKFLKMKYNVDCKCKYCSDDYDDHAYYQFYRYRCQNSSCKFVFTPRIEEQDWWLKGSEFPSFLTCPACKIKLKLDWYSRFINLVLFPTEISKVIKILEYSEKILVGYSELRSHMCEIAVRMFFDIWKRGARFSDLEFKSIGKTIKYWLDVIEEKSDVRSLIYIAIMTFALDLMAHGKYLDFDCKKFCISLDILSTEMRTVYTNYINDYIGERFYAKATSGN